MCTRCRRERRCSTGRCRPSGTSATPRSRTLPEQRVIDFRRVEPARRQLQRAGAGHACRSTSSDRTCTRCPTSPTDPVPHLLLQRDVGLLPGGRPAASAARRRVRGGDRQHARARLADLRRVLRARPSRRRGACLDPRLPSVARATTISAGSPCPPCWPHRSRPARRRVYATGSSSRPARSARSPGSHRNEDRVDRIAAGLTLTCLGDAAARSPTSARRGPATAIDRAAELVLRDRVSTTDVDRLLPLRLRRTSVQLARVPGSRSAR